MSSNISKMPGFTGEAVFRSKAHLHWTVVEVPTYTQANIYPAGACEDFQTCLISGTYSDCKYFADICLYGSSPEPRRKLPYIIEKAPKGSRS